MISAVWDVFVWKKFAAAPVESERLIPWDVLMLRSRSHSDRCNAGVVTMITLDSDDGK